ncbi:hypothetical protein [Paracoccus laeviglucosivorans]|uniref:Uncharacterized protein n=1 Tax=Paracoccus laeviglucosivorans TaxID=1197861 RepID=A0A521AIA1_9RHOB|nr:hypothetical protein [Paracoccus laeviglucosivorans]SMO34507.1 hypothetical protein SAMN06265221_101146 [Paracoccus laeviglucosivorans]
MPEKDMEKDQTTRPSQRKDDAPVERPTTARQPIYDRKTTPDSASGDPTE